MSLNAGSVAAARGSDTSIVVSGSSVTVDATTWLSGTGLATAIAQAHFVASIENLGAALVAKLAAQKALGSTTTALSDTALAVAQGAALQANAYATAIVGHITTNAVVPAGSLLDSGGHACTGSTTIT